MMSKYPILPQRVRRVPRQFSWIDQRLVREQHLDQCSHAAAALYLFLVTVGDARGLSYYADASIMQRLSMDQKTLQAARDDLMHVGLIAFKKPLYQVLSLDGMPPQPAMAQPTRLGDLFKQALGGAS